MNEAEWGLLGMMDSTYTVSCRIGGSSVQRFDYGFTVPMLTTAGSLVITSSPATCSMRVVTGQDPRARPTTLLFLGDIASLVFVLDDNRQYDMFVSDCRVSDGTSRDMLTLIDSDGCPAHRKLIGFTNYNTAMVRGQTYAYAHFKVFKFPDRDNVFVQCKCHVCLDSCNRPACETGAGIGNSKVFRKKRDMGVNDVIVDYDAGEPQIVSDKKNTTVDLYRQITIAIPNKQHIESSHLESSSETGRLPDLEPPIRANSPQRLRTCNSHSRILVIVVIALALLLLLFMTLTALFFHKSRHQTARQSDQMTTSSMYSNTKLVPIR
ncbi:PREDICTED: protein dyf-7-like [Priapulus caudatus]|uniref:Protein dyf-7-like n=1 Tax=Priapulus caudatus TaxID=37621 RepID=A0ABM1DZQ7_PRICU|nr:PREDICTED: protein dyf-7-like [Priapulus caudatus]